MFTGEDLKLFKKIIQDQLSFVNIYYQRKRKNGRMKVREIVAPKTEYKELQKKLLFWLQSNNVFRISDQSFAWMSGKSREQCATRHTGHKYIMELDIKDYFGNITEAHIEGLMVYNEKISYLLNILQKDLKDLIFFLTLSKPGKLYRYLPQGYATSPIIANAIRYEIDNKINRLASENNWVYSAYGDNLYVSGDSVPRETMEFIAGIVEQYGFAISKHKCKVMPYYRQQSVLGIVVNEKLSISRDYLRNVMNEIINTDTVDSHLIGRINQFRISNNHRNFNYLNNLLEKIHGKTTINVGSNHS